MNKKEKQKCIIADCQDVARVRGLCARCYTAAIALVKEGKTSWVRLEEKGLALPSKKREMLNKFLEALAKNRNEK